MTHCQQRRLTPILKWLLAWLMVGLAGFLAMTVQAAEIVDDNRPPTVRNNMHSCPPGHIVTGVHVGNNYLLCLGTFVDFSGYMTRHERVDQGARADNQWPPDEATRAAYGYDGPTMHWCGPDQYVTGIHVANNAFNCARFDSGQTRNYTYQLGNIVIDAGVDRTVRSGMHACPRGKVLVGAHFDTNTFLCAELPFCLDSSHAAGSAEQCEYSSIFCDPGETDCLYPTTGVPRRKGILTFKGENFCRGDSLGGLTDRSGNTVSLAHNPSFENDEAHSLRLDRVRAGTIIRIFDSPSGSTNDDWAEILVKQTTPSNYCIDTFERWWNDQFVSMEYYGNIDLDDAVSRVEVRSAIIGNGGKCLDVNQNNNAVQIFTCHAGLNQSWTHTVRGEIRGLHSRCLEANESDISRWQLAMPDARVARVQVAACDSGANQKWSIKEEGEIRLFGDMCLDIRGGGVADQTPVQIYPCHGGPNQRWVDSF